MDSVTLVSNPRDDARPEIAGVTLSLTILSAIVVSARTWIRTGIVKAFGWDDGLMLVALAGAIASAGVVLAEVHNGHGRHIGDVPPDKYALGMMYNYISQPLVVVFTSIVKLAVGAALLRIANKGVLKGIVIGVMVFTALYTTGAFITIVAQCRPISLNWDESPENLARGSCWAPSTAQGLAYTSIALNIATDLLFALGIPIPMLFRLQMSRRSKLALMFVFALGSLACVAAIVRLAYLTSYGVRTDWLWDARYLTIWSIVELDVGIIAGSMPACKPMFGRLIETTQLYASREKGSPGATSTEGGAKSGTFWKSLASRTERSDSHADDDVGSERHINPGRSMYPMQDLPHVAATAFGGPGALRSDSPDTIDEILSQGSPPDVPSGITKTTITTMSYLPSTH